MMTPDQLASIQWAFHYLTQLQQGPPLSDAVVNSEELGALLSNMTIFFAEELSVDLDDFDDSMDGDAASALASAGMGVGEDYGEFDERV